MLVNIIIFLFIIKTKNKDIMLDRFILIRSLTILSKFEFILLIWQNKRYLISLHFLSDITILISCHFGSVVKNWCKSNLARKG